MINQCCDKFCKNAKIAVISFHSGLFFSPPCQQSTDVARDGVGDGVGGDGAGEAARLLTPQEIAEAAKIWRAYERTKKKSTND